MNHFDKIQRDFMLKTRYTNKQSSLNPIPIRSSLSKSILQINGERAYNGIKFPRRPTEGTINSQTPPPIKDSINSLADPKCYSLMSSLPRLLEVQNEPLKAIEKKIDLCYGLRTKKLIEDSETRIGYLNEILAFLKTRQKGSFSRIVLEKAYRMVIEYIFGNRSHSGIDDTFFEPTNNKKDSFLVFLNPAYDILMFLLGELLIQELFSDDLLKGYFGASRYWSIMERDRISKVLMLLITNDESNMRIIESKSKEIVVDYLELPRCSSSVNIVLDCYVCLKNVNAKMFCKYYSIDFAKRVLLLINTPGFLEFDQNLIQLFDHSIHAFHRFGEELLSNLVHMWPVSCPRKQLSFLKLLLRYLSKFSGTILKNFINQIVLLFCSILSHPYSLVLEELITALEDRQLQARLTMCPKESVQKLMVELEESSKTIWSLPIQKRAYSLLTLFNDLLSSHFRDISTYKSSQTQKNENNMHIWAGIARQAQKNDNTIDLGIVLGSIQQYMYDSRYMCLKPSRYSMNNMKSFQK